MGIIRWTYMGIPFEGGPDEAFAFAQLVGGVAAAMVTPEPASLIGTRPPPKKSPTSEVPTGPHRQGSLPKDRPASFHVETVHCYIVAGPTEDNPTRWLWRARTPRRVGSPACEMWRGWATEAEARLAVEAVVARASQRSADAAAKTNAASRSEPKSGEIQPVPAKSDHTHNLGIILSKLSGNWQTTNQLMAATGLPNATVNYCLSILIKGARAERRFLPRSERSDGCQYGYKLTNISVLPVEIGPQVHFKGRQPPPEHLPGGMVFDALAGGPLTAYSIASETGLGIRQVHQLLVRLVKEGFICFHGSIKRGEDHSEDIWSRTDNYADIQRKAQRRMRWEMPPPTADGHRATPNDGSLTNRVYNALSHEWITSTDLAKKLGLKKKSVAQSLSAMCNRKQIERQGPAQGERGYYYTYRKLQTAQAQDAV